jgi:hypothetical protein
LIRAWSNTAMEKDFPFGVPKIPPVLVPVAVMQAHTL